MRGNIVRRTVLCNTTYELKDVSKPTLRRDWNCPWVKRDGKGLKRVVRNVFGTDPVPAPVKTSHHHFYSEPHSILAPEGPPIDMAELELMIQEKMGQTEGGSADALQVQRQLEDRQMTQLDQVPNVGHGSNRQQAEQLHQNGHEQHNGG